MALIKTIAEVKEVLPKLVANTNSASLLPNFDAIELKYLVPLIGSELYASMQAKYNSNSLSADDTALLRHMRLVTAAYGFHDDLAASHVVITDAGVRTQSTDDMPKAVGWEYKELKNYLKDRALDGTEVLLNYLWGAKADLPLWTASDAYTQFEALLIRTGTDFNEWYSLHQPMRTFYTIRSVVREQQKNYLESGFGKALVDYLAAIADPEEKEKEIIELLKAALANLSVKHAAEKYAVRFTDSGFSVLADFGGDREGEDAGRSAASEKSIEKCLRACDRDGRNFILKAKRELVALRQGLVSENFIAAFDAGPLKDYKDPSGKTTGNERRRIFRF